MNFSKWLENRRELAQSYRDTLSGVPQDPHHHPEAMHLFTLNLSEKPFHGQFRNCKICNEIQLWVQHYLT